MGPVAAPDTSHLEQRQDFNAWHLTRPWIGAVFGPFAALIVILITKTIALTANNTLDVSPTGAATLAAISFVVAYRQQAFRQLVERTLDTILGPGTTADSAESPVHFELTPATLDFKTVATNNTLKLTAVHPEPWQQHHHAGSAYR